MRRPTSKLEKRFADRIKRLRGDEPQISFAKKLGIAQSTLNRIENCEQSVTLYLVEKIAIKLKIEACDLLS